MKKVYMIAFISLWIASLVAIAGYYLVAAPKTVSYSATENRNLAGVPGLSWNSLRGGEYGKKMETYLLDRFPERDDIISIANRAQGLLSFATYEEYLLIAEEASDPLDSDVYLSEIEDLLGDQLAGKDDTTSSEESEAVGTESEMPETEVPDKESTETEDVTTEMPETEDGTTESEKPEPETPPSVQKPGINVSDFPEWLGVYMQADGTTQTQVSYKRDNVLAVTAVLNKYASCLPEDGKLMFTVVPQSSYTNRFVNASSKEAYFADWDYVVNAFANDNVYAFDSAEILGEAMKKNEYVYFRNDMHWTPYGSYLLYKEMVAYAGLVPCDYENDFSHLMESPFRGTYYRDYPAVYMDVPADDLDILTPNMNLEWRRVTGKDSYKLIDFIDMDAKANDRYTVYLGGPGGPWTYAECDNGKEENCLVLMDSFGLGYLPFLTQNYKQVHYYDPRYFNKDSVGYSVAEMIELYNIKDIYVVIGDIHSFNSSFLLSYAYNQLIN